MVRFPSDRRVSLSNVPIDRFEIPFSSPFRKEEKENQDPKHERPKEDRMDRCLCRSLPGDGLVSAPVGMVFDVREEPQRRRRALSRTTRIEEHKPYRFTMALKVRQDHSIHYVSEGEVTREPDLTRSGTHRTTSRKRRKKPRPCPKIFPTRRNSPCTDCSSKPRSEIATRVSLRASLRMP